jgi:hypothetical protein
MAEEQVFLSPARLAEAGSRIGRSVGTCVVLDAVQQMIIDYRLILLGKPAVGALSRDAGTRRVELSAE